MTLDYWRTLRRLVYSHTSKSSTVLWLEYTKVFYLHNSFCCQAYFRLHLRWQPGPRLGTQRLPVADFWWGIVRDGGAVEKPKPRTFPLIALESSSRFGPGWNRNAEDLPRTPAAGTPAHLLSAFKYCCRCCPVGGLISPLQSSFFFQKLVKCSLRNNFEWPPSFPNSLNLQSYTSFCGNVRLRVIFKMIPINK